MERKLAVEVLREIVDACGRLANINGYQISCREKGEDESEKACEIVIFASLQEQSRENLQSILLEHGLEMDESKDKVTVYRAT